MKRIKLLKHLKTYGCEFYREGGRHTIFVNPANDKKSPIPRHTEISDYLAVKICKQLKIPSIKK